MQSLAVISKNIDQDELIILYANSLPIETFGNWIQSQLGFIDDMSITDFKGRVREEARRLNLIGMGQGLGMEEPDIAQANLARQRQLKQSKKYPPCGHCGYTNHVEADCYKRIAEEYIAKQARRQQSQKSDNNKRNRNRNRSAFTRGGA